MRNYGRKVIWSLFFPPVVLLPGCILLKNEFSQRTSDYRENNLSTFQVWIADFFFLFRTLALQLNRTTNHTS